MIGNLVILVDAPALGLQLLIDGILVGAVFALAAYGMALVWGVTDIVNVCQGEFVMLGGFITVLCAGHGYPRFSPCRSRRWRSMRSAGSCSRP
jgi:branched-chain amino acid transport system permease protein